MCTISVHSVLFVTFWCLWSHRKVLQLCKMSWAYVFSLPFLLSLKRTAVLVFVNVSNSRGSLPQTRMSHWFTNAPTELFRNSTILYLSQLRRRRSCIENKQTNKTDRLSPPCASPILMSNNVQFSFLSVSYRWCTWTLQVIPPPPSPVYIIQSITFILFFRLCHSLVGRYAVKWSCVACSRLGPIRIAVTWLREKRRQQPSCHGCLLGVCLHVVPWQTSERTTLH